MQKKNCSIFPPLFPTAFTNVSCPVQFLVLSGPIKKVVVGRVCGSATLSLWVWVATNQPLSSPFTSSLAVLDHSPGLGLYLFVTLHLYFSFADGFSGHDSCLLRLPLFSHRFSSMRLDPNPFACGFFLFSLMNFWFSTTHLGPHFNNL